MLATSNSFEKWSFVCRSVWGVGLSWELWPTQYAYLWIGKLILHESCVVAVVVQANLGLEVAIAIELVILHQVLLRKERSKSRDRKHTKRGNWKILWIDGGIVCKLAVECLRLPGICTTKVAIGVHYSGCNMPSSCGHLLYGSAASFWFKIVKRWPVVIDKWWWSRKLGGAEADEVDFLIQPSKD